MLGDGWMTSLLIALIAAIAGGMGGWWTRQSKREETHLAQWRHITETQQSQIDSLDARLNTAIAHSATQDTTIKQVQDDNRRISRLLDRAVATLRDWISWERSGRSGSPPQVPDELRDLL